MIAAGRHVKVIPEPTGHPDGGGPVLKRYGHLYKGARLQAATVLEAHVVGSSAERSCGMNAGWAPTAMPARTRKAPDLRGLSRERMMGLEPTTFCMASRRSSQLSYIRIGRRSVPTGQGRLNRRPARDG